jgi:hypothetical protein
VLCERGARLFLAWVVLVLSSACAGRKAGPPPYKALDELSRCRADECVEARLEFRHWANAPHYRGRMPYHCDPGSELDGRPDPAIRRLIFVVHGVVGPEPAAIRKLATPPGLQQLRNIQNAMRRAQSQGVEIHPEQIAIIAPSFQRTKQWQPYTDEDRRVWSWANTSWNIGGRSAENTNRAGSVRAERVSAFDVFDEFLRAAMVKFPNLEEIVVVGHSAGGQAVHRYALLGVGVHEHIEAEGVRLRYVVANPGTYAFPLRRRKLPPGGRVRPGEGRGETGDWRWAMPKGCAGWDDWGYGLSDLDETRTLRAVDYAIEQHLRPVDRRLARRGQREPGSGLWRKAARKALLLQYASREIWHLQASTDTGGTFAGDCKATLQGRSRFERFKNFQEAWTLLATEGPRLHFVSLEQVSRTHNSLSVYLSDAGQHLLFSPIVR